MTEPIRIPVCSLNDGTGNDGIKITPDLARQIVELSGISGKLDKTAQLAESKELSDAHFANWEKAMELNTELRAQLAEASDQRTNLRDMLLDCWCQFAVDVSCDGEELMSDGGLSTLEALADELVQSGALERHPSRPVYRIKARIGGAK